MFHVRREQVSDISNSKTICFGDFSWVNNLTFVAQTLIEVLEIEVLIAWEVVWGDDVSMVTVVKVFFESHFSHTITKNLAILLVSEK